MYHTLSAARFSIAFLFLTSLLGGCSATSDSTPPTKEETAIDQECNKPAPCSNRPATAEEVSECKALAASPEMQKCAVPMRALRACIARVGTCQSDGTSTLPVGACDEENKAMGACFLEK
jgi:hypothetical protein